MSCVSSIIPAFCCHSTCLRPSRGPFLSLLPPCLDALQEVDPQFEPVHKLNDSDKIATTTGEENDTVIFKMCVPLP